MFFGVGTTSSVIHAAGAPRGGVSASPKVLVVLVKTNDRTLLADGRFEQIQRSGDVRVDESLAAVRRHVGFVQVWPRATRTSTPRMHASTMARSAIEPTSVVNGEGTMSMPMASCGPAGERAHQRLAEMARASGDQNPHGALPDTFIEK